MKIAILGYGKMGKAITKIAESEGDEVVLKIGSHNLEDLTIDHLQKADVAIEFSRPESAFDNIRLCLESGVPVVSGTTAWLDRMDEAKSLCNKNDGALFYASNFSIGVNILFHVNKVLAQLMASQSSYSVSMEEIHHIHKLDAPSGTAISLAEDIILQLPDKKGWVNDVVNAKPSELPIVSKRVGEVPGTHEVIYSSAIDTISIKHEAHSREGFARGAIMAARWIVGKQGYFEMKDILGL
jgi:4-hydroxy-tetrahydrodipicolinate reductase